MKKVICEICNSMEFIKNNGVYKCKSCGTEYSLEEAKRLLQGVEDQEEQVDSANSISSPLTDLDMEFFKFKSEVIMRYNLYQKCHEFNSNMPYKDDNFKDCFPWKRKIEFENSKEILLNEIKNNQTAAKNRISLDKDAIATRNTEICNLYWEVYNAAQTLQPYLNNQPFISGLIFIVLGCGCLTGLIFYIKDLLEYGIGFFSFLLAAVICIICLIVFAIGIYGLKMSIGNYISDKNKYLKAKEILEKNKALSKEISSFELTYRAKNGSVNKLAYTDWYFEKYKNNADVIAFNNDFELRNKNIEEYGFKETSKVEEYFVGLKGDVEKQIEKLYSVSKKLDKDSVIPEKYKTEDTINGLLHIIINKRATTLKDVLNIYEEEQYRNSVLNTLQSIKFSLGQIQNEFIEINSTLKIGFSAVVQQNAILIDELNSIRITNSAIMIDNLLD